MKINATKFNFLCLGLMFVFMGSRILMKQYYDNEVVIVILEALFYIVCGIGLGATTISRFLE